MKNSGLDPGKDGEPAAKRWLSAPRRKQSLTTARGGPASLCALSAQTGSPMPPATHAATCEQTRGTIKLLACSAASTLNGDASFRERRKIFHVGLTVLSHRPHHWNKAKGGPAEGPALHLHPHDLLPLPPTRARTRSSQRVKGARTLKGDVVRHLPKVKMPSTRFQNGAAGGAVTDSNPPSEAPRQFKHRKPGHR